MDDEIVTAIADAVDGGQVEIARQLLMKHPELLHYDYGVGTWLHRAAHQHNVEMVTMLVELGCDVNTEQNNVHRGVPLERAIGTHDVRVARALLEAGADPNHGRQVIGAIGGDKKNSLQLVKLLDEYGADLHQTFINEYTGQPMNALSTAIDWGKDDVAEYLRSKGAVLPDVEPATEESRSPSDEIVAYFRDHFGPVQPQSLIEIVPSEPPIAIHVVPASSERNYITLFTTGMSTQPMNVPADGDGDFRYAELFIQLPGDWPLTKEALSDPNHGWPIHWLRSTAKFPHQHETWLGGPVTIIAREEPPQPLAPNVQFTSMLLLAERHIETQDGRKIQLYRLTPLYTEERNLEIAEGIDALMRAFDRCSTPFIIDLNRPNVATAN